MKRILVTTLLSTAFLTANALAAPDAVLTRVSGSVTVLRGGKKLPGKSGFALQKGDKVLVQNGAATVFTLGAPPQTIKSGTFVVGAGGGAKAGGSSVWKNVYTGLNQGLGASNRTAAATMRPGEVALVSPVSTVLESSPRRFEWHTTIPSPRYEVVVWDREVEIFRGQTDKTFLPFNQKLRASKQYSWQV
ncbi:hypothetical protein EON80_21985, partial [bacterium]